MPSMPTLRATPAALALVAGLALAGAVRADPCGGADSWSLGGPGFGEDASALAKSAPGCGPDAGRCELIGADGVHYVLGFDGETAHVLFKSRPLRPGETLPLGVLAADTPAQALDKALTAGVPAGYGRTGDPKPVSVALSCGGDGGQPFLLQFRYDQSGRMTGVSETWLAGRYVYVDDPTFHLSLEKPRKR